MLVTIQNEHCLARIDSLGAQLMNLCAGGTEYLWQGISAYWGDRAPNLFPFIGRLTNNSYQYLGKVYEMRIHGFALESEFAVVAKTADSVTMELRADEKTKKQYPFDFVLRITYALRGAALDITFRVENLDGKTLPFGIGGHPGFNVPLAAGETFEDYELVFSHACQPDRVGFSPAVYLNGQDAAYPLENGTTMALRHDLFDEDAVILKNMAREVTLRSKRSARGVRVTYPDMPYLGIWHRPQTDAPYVCIEPWSSLPSRQDVVEEFASKSDLVHLAPGKTYENTWSVTVF